MSVFRSSLAAIVLALLLSILIGIPVRAQSNSPAAGPPTASKDGAGMLPASLSETEIRNFVARLSDTQARDMLLQQLDAQARQHAAATMPDRKSVV